MSKENENIHLHIIHEEYLRKKTNQKIKKVSSEETESLMLNRQLPSSAVMELEKLSAEFENSLTNEEPKQVDPTKIIDPSTEIGASEFLTSLKRFEEEERELLKQKQALLVMRQELRRKIVSKIEAKKIAIKDLKSEISIFECECNNFSQLLKIPINT